MRCRAAWLAPGLPIALALGCAPADTRPAEPMKPVAVTVSDAADDETTIRVQTSLLEDPVVKGFRIDVDTKDGVVYLTGSVGSEDEWAQVIKVAEQTPGVRRVEASLIVSKG
jgi:hyperosmotically inducible periplasmic protein